MVPNLALVNATNFAKPAAVCSASLPFRTGRSGVTVGTEVAGRVGNVVLGESPWSPLPAKTQMPSAVNAPITARTSTARSAPGEIA